MCQLPLRDLYLGKESNRKQIESRGQDASHDACDELLKCHLPSFQITKLPAKPRRLRCLEAETGLRLLAPHEDRRGYTQ